MRFLRDAVITLLLLGAAAAIVVFMKVRAGGLTASQEAGRLERSVARRLIQLSIPAEARQQQNPFGRDADAWRQARDHYLDHCAVCHGDDGKGNTGVGRNMYPHVPDLTSPDVQNRTDGALFYIIQNGVRWTGMPAWQEEHSTDESWKLVSLLRKMPTLTAADFKREETPTHDATPHKHRH